MPGKLLSDADLDSDTAMEKVETPRKQNEKVPPRAEGPGALRGAGYGSGVGCRAGTPWRAPGPGASRARRGVRPRGCQGAVLSAGGGRTSGPGGPELG